MCCQNVSFKKQLNRIHIDTHRNTYKCGAFFENLTGNGGIQWLGALPDALKKADPKDYQEILGSDITEDSFKGFDCSSPSSALAANARCYATVTNFFCSLQTIPFHFQLVERFH